MEYKVKFHGKTYDLPARTLAVDEQIEAVVALDAAYSAGQISRLECVEKMYDFAGGLLPGALPPLEETDTNELTALCTDICAVYAAPALKARNDAHMAELRDVLNRPEVQKALAAMRNIPRK